MLTLNRLKPGFQHRLNASGSYDSICIRCFTTVAKAQKESELAGHESAHTCDEWELYRLSQGARLPRGAGPAFSE